MKKKKAIYDFEETIVGEFTGYHSEPDDVIEDDDDG
jgi:hypothetical protein